MGGDCSVSKTAAYDCRMIGETVTQSMMTRLKKGRSLCAWQCGQVELLWAYSSDINKKHRELRHGAEHDSIE